MSGTTIAVFAAGLGKKLTGPGGLLFAIMASHPLAARKRQKETL